MCVCVCVCVWARVCVCNMEMYISDNIFWSINDKLETILVKDVYFFTERVSLFCIAFSTVNFKRNVCFYVMLLLVTT